MIAYWLNYLLLDEVGRVCMLYRMEYVVVY